ncbi:MAG TPA: glycoside hydrolase family 44 protein, partial [bacterium]|nr:glycoside hydrolase family 44 protein [bacterium]
MTAYNWENNASNAGTDYGPNHEDWFMVPSGVTPPGMPATTLTTFIAGNNALSAASLVTLQMAGYVSANGNCNCDVTETGAADTSGMYWKAVSFTGSSLTGTTAPVTTDNAVYMNEEMSYLLATVGGANSGGAKFYDLDNEPGLWNSTHPLVHPNQAACTEVAGKGVSLATVITAADPT